MPLSSLKNFTHHSSQALFISLSVTSNRIFFGLPLRHFSPRKILRTIISLAPDCVPNNNNLSFRLDSLSVANDIERVFSRLGVNSFRQFNYHRLQSALPHERKSSKGNRATRVLFIIACGRFQRGFCFSRFRSVPIRAAIQRQGRRAQTRS